MSFNDVLALVSVGGFATQRSLELADPAFIPLAKKLSTLFGDERTAKGWCAAVAGFFIGLAIALATNDLALPYLGHAASVVVVALAISMGSNASNSLLKFAENVKEARKKEVEPTPEVTITPKTADVTVNSTVKFLASVSLGDNKRVKWSVLEVSDGGSIIPNADGNGEYTAPARPGTYHIAAVSEANPAATATATVTVKPAA